MNNIQQLFEQTQLAEAAYANLWDSLLNKPLTADADVIASLLDGGMSPIQATDFVARWRVVDHIPDTWSGFSATVFERLDDNGNGTGQYSLAIRGSSEAADFMADGGDIFADGVVLDQMVDLGTKGVSIN